LIGTDIRGLHQGQTIYRHQQAGYMEAPDQVTTVLFFLAFSGPSIHDGVDGPHKPASMCHSALISWANTIRSHPQMKVSTLGLDLAKNVFQIHGVDDKGNVTVRRQLRRQQMFSFFSKRSVRLSVDRACALCRSNRKTSRPP